MVNNDLIIDVTPNEIAIALVEDKQLVELNKEKSNIKFTVGDIYLGKVKKIMPGLNAAFVDVGYEKDAFLHYLDLGPQFQSLNKFLQLNLSKKVKAPAFSKFNNVADIDKHGKITDIIKSGQKILVQIAKEPISNKGPRLSSEISLAGRNLVLIPFSDKVSISQKIKSQEERDRLKRLIQSIKPRNYGVIVRTVAKNRKVAVLDTELRSLVDKWEDSFKQLKNTVPPKLIIGELSRISSILRDILNASFQSIYVNDENLYLEIKEYIGEIAPEKQKIVKFHSSRNPIFEHFGIEKQIKSSFGKTVSFKSGAYLIIEHTEALHVIDVNSGNRSKSGSSQEINALEVNLAAAEEIARQVRLRDMGGIIVVDFIDMHNNENKMKVFDKMKEVMAKDRTKHNILPLTKFGLMQITRQRVRPEMNVQITETCPTCGGSGEISPTILFVDELENTMKHLLQTKKLKYIQLLLHPYIAAYITKGLFSLRFKWMRKYKSRIIIKPYTALSFFEFQFLDKTGEDIKI